MTVKRMDNAGIVVEDIDAAIEFFTEPGLEPEGRAPVEGGWADGVTGLRGMRVMFAVEDIDDTLARLRQRGAKLVGDLVQYQDMHRLCYIRGPEGILIGLAQQLIHQTSGANPV